jgi:malate/lactate dehydrogenase
VRVVIAGGGGGVGASVAFNLLLSVPPFEVVLLDSRRKMLLSHLWDLEQVLEQGATGSIREGSAGDVADADVLVVTASAPLTVNQSRMVYLEANAAILRPLLDLLAPAWKGVLIIVTNPVDPLCTWAQQHTGIDRRRVLGYTLNDSLRVRTGAARALGVAPGSVQGWAVGEHGDLSVALLDRLEVDGDRAVLDPAQRAAVKQFMDGWYVRHVALDSGRSSTWTSGLGIARMVVTCTCGEDEVWPASMMLAGEYGIDGASLSVPVMLGPGGARSVVQWPLTDEQDAGLRAGADVVRAAAKGLR